MLFQFELMDIDSGAGGKWNIKPWKLTVFYYYQKLIKLRNQHDIIVYGDINLLCKDDENIFAYVRNLDSERLIVVLNFFEKEVEFKLPEDFEYEETELLISNYDIEYHNIESIMLRPYEARVYLIK